MLYATVSVHAGGQGGYGGLNMNPYGYPGGTEIAPPGWAGMVDKVITIQTQQELVALSVI